MRRSERLFRGLRVSRESCKMTHDDPEHLLSWTNTLTGQSRLSHGPPPGRTNKPPIQTPVQLQLESGSSTFHGHVFPPRSSWSITTMFHEKKKQLWTNNHRRITVVYPEFGASADVPVEGRELEERRDSELLEIWERLSGRLIFMVTS
ncbi:hypothetical protein SRHO_G00310270 [Serrasalmus rhombeus]